MNVEAFGFDRVGIVLIPEIVISEPAGLLHRKFMHAASVFARMDVAVGCWTHYHVC